MLHILHELELRSEITYDDWYAPDDDSEYEEDDCSLLDNFAFAGERTVERYLALQELYHLIGWKYEGFPVDEEHWLWPEWAHQIAPQVSPALDRAIVRSIGKNVDPDRGIPWAPAVHH